MDSRRFGKATGLVLGGHLNWLAYQPREMSLKMDWSFESASKFSFAATGLC